MAFESEMSFFSLSLKGGEKKELDIEQSAETATYIHITNAALQANPSDGPNTVSVIVNGEESVLMTLAKVDIKVDRDRERARSIGSEIGRRAARCSIDSNCFSTAQRRSSTRARARCGSEHQMPDLHARPHHVPHHVQ